MDKKIEDFYKKILTKEEFELFKEIIENQGNLREE